MSCAAGAAQSGPAGSKSAGTSNLSLDRNLCTLGWLMIPLVFLIGEEDSQPLRNTLQSHHFPVHTLPASESAVLLAAEKHRPSVFLIDAALEFGLELCRTLRQSRFAQIPVLLIFNHDSEDDRIRAFEAGADDVLTKPLRPRETSARIHAVVRRSTYKPLVPRVELGAVAIDTDRFTVSVAGRPVDATATQVRLIELLMRNPGRVFSRDQILDAVWSDSRFVTPRTIDVHIRRIRELIEPNPAAPIYLKTIRGAGYCFVDQAKPQRPAASPTTHWFPPAPDRELPFISANSPARIPSVS